MDEEKREDAFELQNMLQTTNNALDTRLWENESSIINIVFTLLTLQIDGTWETLPIKTQTVPGVWSDLVHWFNCYSGICFGSKSNKKWDRIRSTNVNRFYHLTRMMILWFEIILDDAMKRDGITFQSDENSVNLEIVRPFSMFQWLLVYAQVLSTCFVYFTRNIRIQLVTWFFMLWKLMIKRKKSDIDSFQYQLFD